MPFLICLETDLVKDTYILNSYRRVNQHCIEQPYSLLLICLSAIGIRVSRG